MLRKHSLLATAAVLSLLSGCTTTQFKEAGGAVAGGLLITVLDVALDGPERRADARREWNENPANRYNPCLSPCDLGRVKPTQAELREEAQQKREEEAREYEAGVDAIIQSLDAAERRASQLPSTESPALRQTADTDQFTHRAEAFEDMAKYDAFLRQLKESEEQSGD